MRLVSQATRSLAARSVLGGSEPLRRERGEQPVAGGYGDG
jgi:hypothetical protein